MRSAVAKVTIRKEGGFTREDVQTAYDTFSKVIDSASAEKFKRTLFDAGAIFRARVIATAPYDPNATTFPHIRNSTFLTGGPANKPYVLVGISKKAPQAYWEEYGTVHQPARPFFRPAQQATKGEMANVIIGGFTRGILQGS